ncbi:MAG: MgtC/SapB family protein [Anaerolineales bacterium]
MTDISEIVIKLLVAIFVGGLIGAEREFHDKAAGFRTIIFICLGSTLFTILSLELGGTSDPVRIAASIVTGIGFIGAGVILRNEGHIVGLTTASTVWIAAALGMGIGSGYFLLAGISTGLILIGLWVFPMFDRLIHKTRETRNYHIVFSRSTEKCGQLENIINQCNLRIESFTKGLRAGEMVSRWRVYGSPQNHELLVDKLILDEDIHELHC